MPAIDRRAAGPRSLSPRRWWRCRPWTPGRPGRRRRRDSGARSGGSTIPTSLRSPCAPVPVLSPISHPAGTPAQRVASPVVFAMSEVVSRSRPAGCRPPPRGTAGMLSTMAAGAVVSRSSSGPVERLSCGSLRSKRVVASSRPGANAVTAVGPPRRSRGRFVAVLWLTVREASHRSATVMPVVARSSTAAARGSFTVEAVRNRSRPWSDTVAPLPVSRARTLIRPP